MNCVEFGEWEKKKLFFFGRKKMHHFQGKSIDMTTFHISNFNHSISSSSSSSSWNQRRPLITWSTSIRHDWFLKAKWICERANERLKKIKYGKGNQCLWSISKSPRLAFVTEWGTKNWTKTVNSHWKHIIHTYIHTHTLSLFWRSPKKKQRDFFLWRKKNSMRAKHTTIAIG